MSQKISDNLKDIEVLISHFDLIEFTIKSDKRFGKLMSEFKKFGAQIGVMDTLIASLALEYNKAIVTKNKKHFEKAGVMIKSW